MIRTSMLALLLAVAPVPAAYAASLPGNGITRQEMAGVLTAGGYPARLQQDSRGNPIISSTANGVNFDVYFYRCDAAGRCADLQYAAGWSGLPASTAGVTRTIERVNQWNQSERFLRAYWKEKGTAVWVEDDAHVRRGSRENVVDGLRDWASWVAHFRKFMSQ